MIKGIFKPWINIILTNTNRDHELITSLENFVIQAKPDCYFTNGIEKVQFVVRFIFKFEEYAVSTVMWESELWNNQLDMLERNRASADVLCRHSYKLSALFTVGRKVQLEVTVHPETTPSLLHHYLLLCSVTGFYPGNTKIRWYGNGLEERAWVTSTGLIRNGDWTFQTMVILEMTPEQGNVCTCLVDHPSLLSPVSIEWRAQSECSWKKMLSGVAAFLLGLIFLLVGIIIHLRAQKGYVETQCSGEEVISSSFSLGVRSFS
uniref:Ig-like domain-containing protein n=1 Tax=Equus asinus TaxID=9793 RepID=A0A9L0KIQ5_EQUAS